MKKIIGITVLGVLLLGLGACSTIQRATGGSKSSISQYEGKTVYTQRNLWFQDGRHATTNYKGRQPVPVNTKVTIGDTSDETIELTVADSGEQFEIVNVRKYSRQDIEAIYHRYFAPTKVDLGQFSSKERSGIKEGVVKKGMSKEAVLVARGYPPAHKTPSLEDNSWRFWFTRYNTTLVYFKDGRVSRIKH